jgi:CheY-like chemotaxis protein
MNVLLVEDDKANQKLFGMLCKSWGIDFEIASNGKEAVHLAQSNESKYDLCFMDTDMPVLDGFEAIKIIRRNVKYFPILSTSGDFTYEDKLLRIGADDFLSKPYLAGILHSKIKQLTTKAIRIYTDRSKINIGKEPPMDTNQLKELIELDKKGLALLIVESGQQKFVVHKNIQNKMSHVLIGEGKELFEFLDRGENPANCHLYKCNMQTNRLLLTPQQFEERLKKEDGDIEKYSQPIDEKLSKVDKP